MKGFLARSGCLATCPDSPYQVKHTGSSIGYAVVRTDAQAFGHMTTQIYQNHSQMFSHTVVRCAVFSVITMVSTIFCLNPLLLIREVRITPVKGNILI